MNPIVLLVAASATETVSSVIGGVQTYALAVGVVSLIVAIVLMTLQNKKPEKLMQVLFSMPIVGAVSVELFIAFFLFAWWCVGAGIMTFQGPFTLTSNGYFATWSALAASAVIASSVMPIVADAHAKAKSLSVAGTPLLVLLICSFIVLFAALQVTGSWHGTLMICFSGCSILYCLLMLLAGEKFTPPQQQLASAVVLLMWLAEAFIGTFMGPFVVTSNGYFASWIGLIACIYATQPHLPANMQVKNARESSAARESVAGQDIKISVQTPRLEIVDLSGAPPPPV